MRRRYAWLLLSMLACACDGTPEQPRRATTDKQAMFGDAGLLPTREGERARRELAIAGELEQALAGLGFTVIDVNVELREPIGVIVIARQPALELPNPEAAVTELCHAMIPELAPEHLHLWLHPADTPEPTREPFDLQLGALMLTCIGLGLCIGVLGERLRARW